MQKTLMRGFFLATDMTVYKETAAKEKEKEEGGWRGGGEKEEGGDWGGKR